MSSTSTPLGPSDKRGRYQYLYDGQYFNPIIDAQKRSPKDTKEVRNGPSCVPTCCTNRLTIRHRYYRTSPTVGLGRTTRGFLFASFLKKKTATRNSSSLHDMVTVNTTVLKRRTDSIASTCVIGPSLECHFPVKSGSLIHFCEQAASELNQAFQDPTLTALGRKQASDLGRLLREVWLDELKLTAHDVGLYSSSLRRCISTAEVAVSAIFKDSANTPSSGQTPPPRGKATVIVMDELREWLGWDHNAGSDRRSTKTQIEHNFRDSGVNLRFGHCFPNKDIMFQATTIKESWVDVRRRWERALDYIFDNDPRKYICLFGNNRSLQCGLHVLGLPLDDTLIEQHKKITVLNMENGAVIALLVRRQPLSQDEAEKKRLLWANWEQQEAAIIKSLKIKEISAKEKAEKKKAEQKNGAKGRTDPAGPTRATSSRVAAEQAKPAKKQAGPMGAAGSGAAAGPARTPFLPKQPVHGLEKAAANRVQASDIAMKKPMNPVKTTLSSTEEETPRSKALTKTDPANLVAQKAVKERQGPTRKEAQEKATKDKAVNGTVASVPAQKAANVAKEKIAREMAAKVPKDKDKTVAIVKEVEDN